MPAITPLGPKRSPITHYIQLLNAFPCVPQELVLRQYTGSYGLSDQSPASLVEAVFPVTGFSTTGGFTEIALETLKKNKSLRHPPVPRENVKEDIAARFADYDANSSADRAPRGVERLFSFARRSRSRLVAVTRVGEGCVAHKECTTTQMQSLDESQLAVGYDSGAVVLWSLNQYKSFLERLRSGAAVNGTEWPVTDSAAESKPALYSFCKLWGSAPPLEGMELMGYHVNGTIMSLAYDAATGAIISGSADGSLYLWDAHNRYRKGNHTVPDEKRSSVNEFAAAVRCRRLIRVVTNAHTGPVSKISTYDGTVISGASDGIVKLWQSEKSDSAVNLSVAQVIYMHGWIRSIEVAFPYGGIQLDDVIITDDSGYMVGLKAYTPEQQKYYGIVVERANGSLSVGSYQHSSTLGSCISPLLIGSNRDTLANGNVGAQCQGRVFRVSRAHQFHSEEAMRVVRLRTESPGEHTNSAVRVLPLLNYSLAMCISYSPHLWIADYTKLKSGVRLSHPLLTADGPSLQEKEISSIYRRERERRSVLFREKHIPRTGAAEDHLFPGNGKVRNGHRAEPLRFIDALYIPCSDTLILLDNRNSVFVWERETSTFVATVAIASASEDSQCKQAMALLPCGAVYNDEKKHTRGAFAGLDDGRDSAHQLPIPFFVVCDTGVDLYCITPTVDAVIEIPAHTCPVAGVSFTGLPRRPTCSTCQSDGNKTADASGEGPDISLLAQENVTRVISVSEDGCMKCWGEQLRYLRHYTASEAKVASGAILEKTTAFARQDIIAAAAPRSRRNDKEQAATSVAAPSDVTSFLFSERWDVALTGHDNGDLCFWEYFGELADVVAYKRLHSNTLSALAEGRTDESDEVLVTAGFDGFLAFWGNPERRCATPKGRLRVTWNELLCVGFCEPSQVVATGDSEGNVFMVSARDSSLIFVCPLSPQRSCLVLAADATPAKGLFPGSASTASDTQRHWSAVTVIAVVGPVVITGDDEGSVLTWDTERQFCCSTLLLTLQFGESEGNAGWRTTGEEEWYTEEQRTRKVCGEINCIASVPGEPCVLIGTRSGKVLLYNLQKKRTPLGVYQHSCEVTSIAADWAATTPDSNHLAIAVGGNDGSIMLLAEESFRNAHAI